MFVFTGTVFDCNFQEPLIKQEHPEIVQTPFDPYAWLHFAAHPLSKTAVPIYLQTVLVNETENGAPPPLLLPLEEPEEEPEPTVLQTLRLVA